MNYKFIYDEEFRQKYFLELSDEEVMLVRVIVSGGHNAIIYGYKPERVVSAIKQMTSLSVTNAPYNCSIEDMFGGGEDLHMGYVSTANMGMLVLENLHEFRSSVLQIVRVSMENGNITLSRAGESKTYGTKFQLVATMKGCECGNINSTEHNCLCSSSSIESWWKKIECIKDKCPIIYRCVDHTEKHMVEKPSLWNSIETDNHTRLYRTSSTTFNSVISESDEGLMKINFTSGARDVYENSVVSADLCRDKFDIARVARTIADCRGHNMTKIADIDAAIELYNPVC